jgi:hypothetical protein
MIITTQHNTTQKLNEYLINNYIFNQEIYYFILIILQYNTIEEKEIRMLNVKLEIERKGGN